jgi:hypothetical protein
VSCVIQSRRRCDHPRGSTHKACDSASTLPPHGCPHRGNPDHITQRLPQLRALCKAHGTARCSSQACSSRCGDKPLAATNTNNRVQVRLAGRRGGDEPGFRYSRTICCREHAYVRVVNPLSRSRPTDQRPAAGAAARAVTKLRRQRRRSSGSAAQSGLWREAQVAGCVDGAVGSGAAQLQPRGHSRAVSWSSKRADEVGQSTEGYAHAKTPWRSRQNRGRPGVHCLQIAATTRQQVSGGRVDPVDTDQTPAAVSVHPHQHDDLDANCSRDDH